MIAFGSALAFVLLAEMGDKTQLLAMAFAAKFKWQTVMGAIFVSTALNHLLAVAVGSWLTDVIPMTWIAVAASISFVIFGLWTLRGDKLNGEETQRHVRSPFWTVAIAFFLAEMGDKTQLATITLSAQFDAVVPIWAGTLIGMMIADGIGILIGCIMGKRIPEKAVKYTAAAVFIACGFFGLYDTLFVA